MNRFFWFCLLLPFVALAQRPANGPAYSPNGEVFTPHGDLRILVVCVGFDSLDQGQDFKNWPADQEFPSYIKDGKFLDAFYSDYDQFDQYDTDTSAKNISKLFNQMSRPNHDFRMVADVYPHRINVDPVAAKARGWAQVNALAIKEMRRMDPDFDWSPYDNRTNRPNFKFDNSKTEPDRKPDYVILYYRYKKGWKHQFISSMPKWIGSGGGVSTLSGVRGLKYNGYTFSTDGFYVNTVGTSEPEGFKRLFKHELGHELFSCPHYFGASGTIGKYFYIPTTGWGTAVITSLQNSTLNAWERWLLGWIDIKHDLSLEKGAGVYKIRDTPTTGDAIRIKIPHTKSEYLWIENHQHKSVYSKSRWTGQLENKPPGSSGIAEPEKGLYMYSENIMDARTNIGTYLVSDITKVNGMRIYHAGGNWDYDVSENYTKSWGEYWNNRIYTFERKEENVISGVNPYLSYRKDYDGDGKIRQSSNYNNAKTESYPIVKEIVGGEPKLLYGNHGGRNADALPFRRSDAFQSGDIIGMGHNPMVLNNPKYDAREKKLKPFYLNGIKIVVLAEDQDGTFTIEVSFDQTDLAKDTRFCGEIYCRPVPTSQHALRLEEGVTLSLDRSGTPNRLDTLDGDFINRTRFVIDSGAHVLLEKKAEISVVSGSVLVQVPGANLTVKRRARISIDEGEWVISSGANLDIRRRSIKIKSGKMRVEKGAVVNGKSVKETKVFDEESRIRF